MRAVVVMLLGLLAACPTKANPNQCCTDQADCAAHGIPVGTSCGQGLVCRGNQCIAEVCMSSADCDAAAPYCDAQSCSEQCTADSQCPGYAQDSSAVYCVNGTCEQCRSDADCPMTAPTCDMGTCHGCTAHADCASNLCDTDTATCVPESAVIYATPTGSTSSDCTTTAPCSFERAFAVVSATRNQIKLDQGTYTNTGVTVTAPNVVSVYGPATVNGGAGIAAIDGGGLRIRDLTVNGGIGCIASQPNMPMNHVDVARVTLGDNQTIVADTCELRMSQLKMHILPNAGAVPAITADGEPAGNGATTDRTTTVTLDRCEVDGGDPGIIMGVLATFQITNSLFINQGTTHGAFQLTNSRLTTSTVSFTTVYNTLVECPTVTGNGSFASSNNIIVNRRSGAPADTATGTYCTHNYDLVAPQGSALNGASNIVNMDPKFANTSINDFHLLMGSPAIDAADPAATLGTDYDGTTRPQGAARDIGAFEYKP